MKEKFIKFYCKVAENVAELSHARRLKVGAVAVKDDRIISFGYNGMPSGWNNDCEEEIEVCSERGEFEDYKKLVTRPEVLHAESNVIAKIAKSNESSEGATLFLTHAPCIHCAKQVYQAGFVQVYYINSYGEDGIYFLHRCGVKVEKV